MDREEAERLARRFAPSVYRLAYARTGHRADAEDVMQEVFLRLMRAACLAKEGASAGGGSGPDTAWAGDEQCTGGGDDPAVQLSDSTPPVLL